MTTDKASPCIVRGNDFTLKIPLFLTADGQTAPFEPEADQIRLCVKSSLAKYAFPFTISGNELSVRINGREIVNGLYGVEITVSNDGNLRSYTLARFRIVESDDLATVAVGTEVVQLSAQITVDYGAGFFNYTRAVNKPKINGVVLVGDKSLSELGVQPAGDYLAADAVSDWAKAEYKPVYTSAEVGALPADTPLFSGDYNDLNGNPVIPTKVSDLTNDSGYLTEESDPTVPAWAKQPEKPAYTAAEVGAATPAYVDRQIAALPVPDVSGQISAHNQSNFAHSDIRATIPKTPTDIGAEPAQIVHTITGEWATIDAEGGNSYLCGTLTALTLTAENSPREAVIRFTSGDTATTLTLPATLKRCGYWGITANRSYEISIANNLALLVSYE